MLLHQRAMEGRGDRQFDRALAAIFPGQLDRAVDRGGMPRKHDLRRIVVVSHFTYVILRRSFGQRGGLFFRLGKFEFPATFRLEEGVLAASGLSYR